MDDNKQATAGLRIDPMPAPVPDHFIALLAANAAASTTPRHARRWAPVLAAAACTAVIGAAALIAGTQLDPPGVDPVQKPDAPSQTETPDPPAPSPDLSTPPSPTTDRDPSVDRSDVETEAPGSIPAATPSADASPSGTDDHAEDATGHDAADDTDGAATGRPGSGDDDSDSDGGDASASPDVEDDEHSGPGNDGEEPGDNDSESDEVEDNE